MRACVQCGAVLLNGRDECSSCGATTAQQQVHVPDEEINHLLAEANLLRIRKQSVEAINICTRVLRLSPSNPTAHSLMGDIHREMGNYREALGWFKLAVQLDPHNAADRKKLDEMIDRVFKGVSAGGQRDLPTVPAAPVDEVSFAPSPRPSIFERITPTHVIVASVVLALIVMLAISGIFAPKPPPVVSNPGTPTTVAPTPSPTTVPFPSDGESASPQVVPPGPDPVEGGGTKIPGLPIRVHPGGRETLPTNDNPEAPVSSAIEGGDSSAPPPTAQVPPFEPTGRAKMSAEDLQGLTEQVHAALQEALRASKLPSSLDGVVIDPRSNVVTLYYSIPPMAGPLETKQGLIFTGFKLIWAADKVHSTFKAFTLRGYAPPEAGKPPALALVADVSPQQADDAREAGDYRAVLRFMSNVWWRNDIDAAQL